MGLLPCRRDRTTRAGCRTPRRERCRAASRTRCGPSCPCAPATAAETRGSARDPAYGRESAPPSRTGQTADGTSDVPLRTAHRRGWSARRACSRGDEAPPAATRHRRTVSPETHRDRRASRNNQTSPTGFVWPETLEPPSFLQLSDVSSLLPVG